MSVRRKFLISAVWAALFAGTSGAWANPVLDAGGPGGLSLFNVSNLNSFNTAHPTGLFEGIAITSNTLYLSLGDPTTLTQSVWALPLVRSNGHITGVDGNDASLYKSITNGGGLGDILGGGLVTVSGGIIYTMLPTFLGQAVGTPSLTNLGVVASVAGLQYLPGNAGKLKVSTTNGDWYTVGVSGTAGSYTVGSVTQDSMPAPVTAYSFDYVPVDATFTSAGMILGDAGSISYYQLNGNGDPVAASVIHLVDAADATVGYGVARDPFTGDVLFTTGDNQIFNLSDTFDTPEPSTILLALGGLALLATARRVGQASCLAEHRSAATPAPTSPSPIWTGRRPILDRTGVLSYCTATVAAPVLE